MSDLRTCCQQAALDGFTPEQHYKVCDARAEDPQTDVLFELPEPAKEGGPLL